MSMSRWSSERFREEYDSFTLAGLDLILLHPGRNFNNKTSITTVGIVFSLHFDENNEF